MRRNERINLSASVLWASVFVIIAMIIVQAGKLPGNAAYAEMATGSGSYTVLTTNSGKGGDSDPNELLYVIDSTAQVLLVYEIEDSRSGNIFLRDGGSLVNLFNSARR